VVDFDGPGLAGLTRDSGVEALVSVNRGQLESAVAYPVVGTSLWRLMADVRVQDPDSADIRAYLQRGGAALTETWTYQLFNR
jgi:glucans biosynthesis protein